MNVILRKNKNALVIPFHNVIMFILIIAVSGCVKKPTEIRLKGDLSESEFQKALIGEWESVYLYEERQNVKRLEVFPLGVATVYITNGSKAVITGKYKLYFPKHPKEDTVTYAEMTITFDDIEIQLRRMHFGYHNGVPMNLGLLLRIDESPYGVLSKIE